MELVCFAGRIGILNTRCLCHVSFLASSSALLVVGIRCALRWAANGPELAASNTLRCRICGTTSWVLLLGFSLTSRPSLRRTCTCGRCDHRFRLRRGIARSWSRVGSISSSSRWMMGTIVSSSRCRWCSSSLEVSGSTARVWTPNGAVSSSALSNSSIQGVVKDLPQHCLQIGLETPSALQCSRPGRCSIS